MTKKLVGNQSLLDKNDDGKISGEDFAELRKEKRVKASRGAALRKVYDKAIKKMNEVIDKLEFVDDPAPDGGKASDFKSFIKKSIPSRLESYERYGYDLSNPSDLGEIIDDEIMALRKGDNGEVVTDKGYEILEKELPSQKFSTGGRLKASRGRKIREGLEFIIDSIKNNKFLSKEAKEELIESETILDNIKKTDFIPDAASKTDAEKTKAVTDFLQENEALDLDGLRKLDRFIFSLERKGGLLSNRGVPEKTIKKILEVDFPLYKTSEKDLTSSEKSLKNKVDKFYNVDRFLRRDERTPMLVVHEKGREPRQEGGAMEDMKMPPEMMGMEDDMPIDTYPNIPPEEMAEAEASQLPDAEMEENYLSFVFDQSLDDEEQDYLTKALEADPKLSQILDKVVITASEFSGAGKVEGPGTGVSDSIPARLSDGEFVFTKKATDQIGAGNLQRMMDDAERAFDGGMMRESKRMGGMMMKDEDPDLMKAMSNEDINRQMLMSNRAPSLLGTN